MSGYLPGSSGGGYLPSSGSAPSGGGGSHGVTGFISNLVKDIGSAARGTPAGIEQLATHPVRTAENIGKSTWQTWSPLFHGDLSQFGHQFYDHPLAPMLDIATVFTGGASVAAKLGTGLERAGVISGDSALAKLGKLPTAIKIKPEGNTLARTKYLPSNPIHNIVYRKAMQAADSSSAIPSWFLHPMKAEQVYGRLEKVDWAHSGLALNAQIAAMMKAGDVFNKAGHSDWAYLENNLFGRNYQSLVHHSPEVPLKQVLGNNGRAPEGFTFVSNAVDTTKPLFKSGYAKNVNEFANHVGSLDKKFTTRSVKNAVIRVDEHGNQFVKVAHSRALEATMLDAKNGAHFLAKIARYPTTVWKAVTLGYSPRVVVNNGLGNWFMYAMRQGGAHSLKGFVDAVRYTRGEKAAMSMLKDTGKLSDSHFLNRYFADELGNTFGSSTLGSSLGGKNGVGSFSGGVQGIYKKSFYPLVHKYADVPVRAASISAYLRGDRIVKGLMRQGHDFQSAADVALKASPELRDRAALHARSVAGDYTTMSGKEQAVRDFIPFYLWDKHIAKHAINMLRDRPGTVTVGTGVGQQGADATRKQLGNIPDWMLGSIPLGFHVHGRTALLNTQGMNPYSSVPDLVGFAQALTSGHTSDSPGDTILGTVNPLIKGIVEHTMGQKATGAPITSHGGVLPSALVDIFNSLRPVQVGRSLGGLTPAQTKNPRLYHTDINTILSSLVGAPVQEADLNRAHALAQQIANGGKKPRKSKSPYG